MNEITIGSSTTRLVDIPPAQSMLANLNSERSKREYARDLERFDDWRAGRHLTRLTVLSYVQKCEDDGLSSSTINRRLAAIRGLVREAEISGFIPANAARPILAIRDRKKTPVKAANWLEKSQVSEILSNCDGSVRSKRDRALFAIAVTTGLRRSELASLTWQQLKRRRRKDWLIGVDAKGGKKRDVVIQASAMKYVRAWREQCGTKGPIFRRISRGCHISEAGVSDRSIAKILAGLCEEIGEDAAAHDLRRTYAALLYEAGVVIREIQALLGHSSVETTERYLKPVKLAATARNDYFTL